MLSTLAERGVGGAGAAGVAEELAEAVGHLDVGRDFGVLLFGERGDVDGVLDDAELEVVADLVGELDADGFLGFVGGAGDVRAEQDVVEAEVGRVLERLLAEDVERGAGDVAGLDGFGEGFVDDELAAGAVDDADALLHDGDGVLVDEAFGLRREADVQREEVGAGRRFRRWETRVTSFSRAMTGAMKGS